MPTNPHEEDLLRFHLATLPSMGPVSYNNLLRVFKTPSCVMGAAEGDLVQKTGIRGNLAAEIVEAESNIEESEEVLAMFAAIGVQVLESRFIGDADQIERISHGLALSDGVGGFRNL